nr:unnamed protein product [Callosobruchus analis]
MHEVKFTKNQRRLRVRRLNSPEPQTQTDPPAPQNPTADVLPAQPATTKAATTLIVNGQKLPKRSKEHKNKRHKPKWQIRIENKISTIRKELAHLAQYINNNNPSKRILTTIDNLRSKSPQKTIIEIEKASDRMCSEQTCF